VATDWLKSGRYELEVASERLPAEIHLAPLYDPAMVRIKS
jgi:sarcosine dehydrogenase